MEVQGIPMIKIPLRTPCCNRVVASVFTDEPKKTVTRTCPNLWCRGTIHHRNTYQVTVTRDGDMTYGVKWEKVTR